LGAVEKWPDMPVKGPALRRNLVKSAGVDKQLQT